MKREPNKVPCTVCSKTLTAHLADYTLRDAPQWEWVPICFDCKNPQVTRPV